MYKKQEKDGHTSDHYMQLYLIDCQQQIGSGKFKVISENNYTST